MKNKRIVIIAVVAIVLVLAGGYLVFASQKKAPAPKQNTSQALDEGEVLPTVDPSVKVDLTSTNGKKEVLLKVDNIPQGTEAIDYELSYQEKTKGLQGAIGTISPNGEKMYEKKITLGTCSSGKCVYHEVVGAIKVTLKFTIGGVQQIFEKDYDI